MFGKKKPMPNNIVMNPSFQQDELEENMSNLVYNPQMQNTQNPMAQQVQPMPVQNQQVQPIQQVPIKSNQRAIITKTELTENKTIKFEGEATYLINIGDCQVIQ